MEAVNVLELDFNNKSFLINNFTKAYKMEKMYECNYD